MEKGLPRITGREGGSRAEGSGRWIDSWLPKAECGLAQFTDTGSALINNPLLFLSGRCD